MAIALVKSAAGSATTQAVTASLGSASTAGNLLVLTVSGDATATVPAGWTQSTGMGQVSFHGSYVWWKISAGETSVNFSLSATARSAWAIAEFSGVDPTPYDVSQGQIVDTSGTTYTTASITPTSGERLLVGAVNAARYGSGAGSAVTVGTWTNSFTAITSGSNTNNTYMVASLAYRLVTANGSTAYSTGGTYSASVDSRSGLVIAFKAASASGVTGTLAATESGSDAAALAGGVLVGGSLAATETGADTASLSGTVAWPAVTGTLTASEAGTDAAAFIGAVVVRGALTAIETGSDAASFIGSVVVGGVLAAQEAGADTAAALGAVLVAGALAASETGLDIFVAFGAEPEAIVGTLAVVEVGSDTAAFSGGAVISGLLAATEAGTDVAALVGGVVVSGVVAVSETGQDGALFIGSVTVAGFLAVVEAGSDTFYAFSERQIPPADRTGSLPVETRLLVVEAIVRFAAAPAEPTRIDIAPAEARFAAVPE